MQIYRRIFGAKLSSFEDPIADIVIKDRSLGEHQLDLCHQLGLDLADWKKDKFSCPPQSLIFEEDIFFTKNFLKAVIELSQSERKNLRFCLAPNSFNERFVLPHASNPSENLKFHFYYLHDANSKTFEDVVVKQETWDNDIWLPPQIIPGRTLSYDICDNFAVRMASPFHQLQATLALHLSQGVKIRKFFAKYFGPNFFHRFLKGGSRRFYSALKSRNKIGKNCLIHPTAILEGVELEDNVVIGAQAIVRMSRIGEGTKIEDQALIKYCVIGKRNYISHTNQLIFCQTLDDVFSIHGPYQFSIFGRETAVMAVINCDLRLDQGTIKIQTDCGLLDSRQHLLGIAYGHKSKVGAGAAIAAGRIVPNDERIAPVDTIITQFKLSKNHISPNLISEKLLDG